MQVFGRIFEVRDYVKRIVFLPELSQATVRTNTRIRQWQLYFAGKI